MAIAFVIGTTKQNNGDFTTSAIDTTGANLIVLSLSCSHGGINTIIAHVSDSKGNTWLNTGGIFQVDGSNNADSSIVYCINPTVGAGHTFTVSGAGSLLQSMCVGAYSGASGGFDTVHSGGNSAASFTVQPGSVTPNQSNSLIIVCGTAVQVSPTLSVNQSFTIRENQPLVAGQTYGSWIMDLFQGTAAAVNPTITSNMNTNGMGALTFVFKGVAEAAPYVPPPPHKPPKPPKPPKVGKPGPKGKPKNYNVDSSGPAATAYRRELAAIQRRHVVPGGIIYTLASGNAAGVGAATAFSQYGLLSVGAAAGVGAASAVSANLALSIASAIGAGAASGVGTGGTFAVGTVAGVGAAGGVTNYNALSVGTAAGIGAAFGISPTLMYAVGQSAGAGGAFGVTSVIAFSAGMAAGAARVRAIGVMQGRVLPFDIDRAWAIDINGSIIDAVQYDPITMVLRVIYVVPLVIDVGGMPYSITNTIGSSPDPQAYVLGLVASAVN